MRLTLGTEDQSDNSVMSNRSQRRVNRVNSSDSQCYFDVNSRSNSRNTLNRVSKESKRARSRSTDHLPNMQQQQHTELNSMSIRKMLRPVHTAPDSPVTSPENARHHGHNRMQVQSSQNTLKKGAMARGRLEKANSGVLKNLF